jgi:uncharacterized protein involved in exopolysaccharide biosynthesis
MNQSSIESAGPTTSSLSLKSLAAVLCRRKAILACTFMGIFSAVALVTFLMPRQYESRMKVFVKHERADLVVSPDARNGAQVPNEISENQVNSEMELLTSNDILSRVVRVCHLSDNTSGVVQATGEPTPEAFERAVRRLSRDLKITSVRKADIIQVTYTANRPENAAAVLKELSNAYLDEHLKVHRTAGTQEFFRSQAARYEAALRKGQAELSQFRLQNNLTGMDEQKDLILRKQIDTAAGLKETDAALAETRARIADLHQQIAAQTPRIVTQTRSLPNQYSVERLNTMLAELENRRTQALMKFRPDDRIVTELEQEIADTHAALDNANTLTSVEQSTDVNPLRHTLESDLAAAKLQKAGLLARRESLARMLGSYQTRIAQLESATIEHNTLERTVKESEEIYLLYARKQEEARIADSLDQQKIANVAIAEAPVEHHLPAKPNVAMNLSVGFLLAGFVSIGSVFAAEYAGATFHTPADLESAVGIPVLATIPFETA